MTKVHELDATQLEQVSGARRGAELHMIELQSQMAQRQMALQLCTNMLTSLNGAASSIAGNVGK